MIGLEDLLDRKPKALSGGQRQRVAMGRAIVRRPKVFLMDEPLSNLDAKLRVQMRSEVARIQHELKATTVYVTHDQVEAMTMGDRVALMRRGVLQQVDTPMRLYNAPANLFVASFIGSPAMNLFEAQLNERRRPPRRAASATSSCAWTRRARRSGELERYAGTQGRARHPARASRGRGGRDRRARASAACAPTVTNVEALGAELIAHLEIAGRPVMTDEVKEVAADLDDSGDRRPRGRGRRRQAAARRPLRRRLAAPAPTQSIEVVVDTSRVHYFDLDTGAAIGGHPVAGV